MIANTHFGYNPGQTRPDLSNQNPKAELLSEIMPLDEVEQVLEHIAEIAHQIVQIKAEMAILGRNMTDATPVWEQRKNKGSYLRLVHPSDNKGRRRREYVGNKKDRIDAALARVANFEKYTRLKATLKELENTLRNVGMYWNGIKQVSHFGYTAVGAGADRSNQNGQ